MKKGDKENQERLEAIIYDAFQKLPGKHGPVIRKLRNLRSSMQLDKRKEEILQNEKTFNFLNPAMTNFGPCKDEYWDSGVKKFVYNGWVRVVDNTWRVEVMINKSGVSLKVTNLRAPGSPMTSEEFRNINIIPIKNQTPIQIRDLLDEKAQQAMNLGEAKLVVAS